jgi:glucokinase
MEANPDSLMWKIAPTLNEVNGITAFAARNQGDAAAAAVVENYIKMLGEGLASFATLFRPDMILLGGGVSAQGDELTDPLQEYVNAHIFGGSMGPGVTIACATLGNSAGLVGGAALWM